jgi:hypothetical protein
MSQDRVLTVFGSLFPGDLFAMQVFEDEIVLMFPDGDHTLVGKGIHRAAPLLAMGEPLPVAAEEVFAALFAPGQAPVLTGTSSASAKQKLDRPLALPAGTEWVLFDTNQSNEPKWLVRLCDLRRITLSKGGRVCIVFNDFVFAVMPDSGMTPPALFALIDRQFPKSRNSLAKPGEISVFSVWRSQMTFLQPFPAIGVATIERLEREEDLGDLSAHLGDVAPLRPRRGSGPSPTAPEQSM